MMDGKLFRIMGMMTAVLCLLRGLTVFASGEAKPEAPYAYVIYEAPVGPANFSTYGKKAEGLYEPVQSAELANSESDVAVVLKLANNVEIPIRFPHFKKAAAEEYRKQINGKFINIRECGEFDEELESTFKDEEGCTHNRYKKRFSCGAYEFAPPVFAPNEIVNLDKYKMIQIGRDETPVYGDDIKCPKHKDSR